MEDNKIMLPQTDHDLLIRVDTTLGHLRDDFKKMNDTTRDDVADLKRDKLSRADFNQWKDDAFVPLEKLVAEQAKAISWQSRMIWMAGGALVIIEIIVQAIFAGTKG